MIFIQGKDRTQTLLFPQSLEEIIDPNHEVRLIDLFVESIKLEDFDFKLKTNTLEGRPPYNPKDLLKLYIYGYLNSIRSSRVLKKIILFKCKVTTESLAENSAKYFHFILIICNLA